MISALILPVGPMDDETVDVMIARGLKSGLIACNAMTGPFRISFFPKNHIPHGWARIGLVDKTSQEAPCAA